MLHYYDYLNEIRYLQKLENSFLQKHEKEIAEGFTQKML